MDARQKTTIDDIKNFKNKDKPMAWLTAYTAPMAEILDAHCDVLLVGDSLGMVLYGMDNTLGVTLDMIINHARAVVSRAQKAAVIVDMPFGTYEHAPQDALKNARRIMDETGCDGLKLEGGAELADTYALLVSSGIPVMAHIGLMPQSVVKEGGYKIKGKTQEDLDRLIRDAKTAQSVGVFGILLEGVIESSARAISEAITIPTVGIGASAGCDGQVLVTDDMLGLLSGHTPKFAKKYARLAENISEAVALYADDVRTRRFPSEEYTYTLKAKAQ